MSALELGAAVEAGARVNYERHYGNGFKWCELNDAWLASSRAIVLPVITAVAPVIESAVRAQIAAEFDVLAAKLTVAIERTTDTNARSLYQDRRAQMATAAQMVRGKVGA